MRAGRLDVVVDALDSCRAQLPRPLGGDVANRGAALEVGLLCDQLRALEDLLKVSPGEPLALGDQAEAVGARRLGCLGVLEDLLGLHHRVHRRVCLGVAGLGAEAAVLGAATRLGVDQRAHVGGVAEVLAAHRPGTLDQLTDLPMVGQLAQGEGFLKGDQGQHAAARLGVAPDGEGVKDPYPVAPGVLDRVHRGVGLRDHGLIACPRVGPWNIAIPMLAVTVGPSASADACSRIVFAIASATTRASSESH